MVMQSLKEFFMWCLILNAAMLMVIFIVWISIGDFIYSMHTKLFEIDRKKFDMVFYSFIGFYKLMIFIFALVPWLALVIVS